MKDIDIVEYIFYYQNGLLDFWTKWTFGNTSNCICHSMGCHKELFTLSSQQLCVIFEYLEKAKLIIYC